MITKTSKVIGIWIGNMLEHLYHQNINFLKLGRVMSNCWRCSKALAPLSFWETKFCIYNIDACETMITLFGSVICSREQLSSQICAAKTAPRNLAVC